MERKVFLESAALGRVAEKGVEYVFLLHGGSGKSHLIARGGLARVSCTPIFATR